jgi:hypothetical protein
VLEGGSISSKIEGATDLVRCEDVRSCAIDYAIRRDMKVSLCVDHNGIVIRNAAVGSRKKWRG